MDVVALGALRAWMEYMREMGLGDMYHSTAPRHVVSEAVLNTLRGNAPVPGVAPRTVQGPVQSGEPVRAPVASAGELRPPTASGTGRDGSSPLLRDTAASERRETARRETAASPPLLPKSPHTSLRSPALQSRSAQAPAEERTYFDLESEGVQTLPPELAAPMPKPQPLEALFPATAPVTTEGRPAALVQLRAEIGDCTRCPLAYAGRHNIVFGDGDPAAQLMFVGEGPGADEDATGLPFVGKAGQLLNNMISAMGLRREQVYIANIVKCRPPGNRTPEFAEATTCSQFLLRQIDVVRPKVIVALGSTAATYLLGVRQPLSALRGQWFSAREAKVAVTYHPAFLLRDPRQKAEAWKDLQRVMAELG